MPSRLSPDQLERYKRHLLLPGVGPGGQEQLLRSRVLIVGAGGLGCPASLYLAAGGVGTIGLVDFDRVDASNLQRQVLFNTGDVGKLKTEVAASRLVALNPDVDVQQIPQKLEAENAEKTLRGYDVVVDGTDTFPSRYLLNDVCVWLGIPLVSGSVQRFEGHVSTFDARRGPCYRCLFPEPPPPELAPNCAEAGVLGVLPGVIGMLQATEALKLLLGAGETLVGRLLVYDALAMEFRQFTVAKDPTCAVCGADPTIREPIDYEAFCSAGEAEEPETDPIPEMLPQDLRSTLDGGTEFLLLDVREPVEWEIANIEGAKLVPLGELPERVGDLEDWRRRPIVVYCHTGVRSRKACEFLMSQGFENVSNLRSGIDGWSLQVDSDVPRY